MKKTILPSVIQFNFFFLLVGFVGLASAHHSHGNYKVKELIEVQGVVTEFHLANPHVWVFLEVVNDQGVSENWAVEGGGANSFKKQGWDAISEGDRITVSCAPTRDGENGCLVKDISINSSNEQQAGAPEWVNMVYSEQLFSANFPSEPVVTKESFIAEYGGTFLSTVYTVENDDSFYSVTVVDYSDAKQVYLDYSY